MDLNLTLLGQMLTFAVFVWFTTKFVWPSLEAALKERSRKIAEGLAAAEQGKQILEKNKLEVESELKTARKKRDAIIAEANKQASHILEEAKMAAQQEHDDIVAAGELQVLQSMDQARVELQTQMAKIVVLGAEKVIARSINMDDQQAMLDQLVASELR